MPHFKILLCVMSTWLLAGCAALREPGESAWQTMHAIDTIQTFHLVSDARYKEVESAWLIGEHPDTKAVLAWSVGSSVIHAGVTHMLIANDFPRLSKLWQYVTLSTVCSTVGQNAAIGVRIGGPNAGPDSSWRAIDDRSQISLALFGP